MGIPVLLASTATRWFGTARMPRAFARAGFDVALLAPKGSLAEKSRFVGRIGHLADNATPRDWIYAFAATVKATAPRVVVPCDDMSLRLVDLLAQAPPDDMAPELRLQLAALIRESLGDPKYYRTSIEKTLLPPAARALGVRVPEHAIVAEFAAADAFAATHGYPVVLKRNYSTAGDGVAIAENRDSLKRAFGELETAGPPDRAGTGKWLIQQHIRGHICYENVASWQGKRLAGFAVDRLVAHGDVKGPAAVIRWFHSPELRDISERLVRGFGMSGLFATECVIHERTGDPYLIEINRRLTPGMHIGERIGVDLCAALHVALTGTAPTSRSDPAPGEEGIGVHFPQEWLRDPESSFLRDYPVDIPWDDPDLLDAMVAMRKQ
ncbi:MAG TPA: ATP-grasp domain-containing protein [Casimicrobiaceae bacterium]|nr:ATP-grasp domain-containing protein [Casimicrobiaceae bacterium]